MENANFYSDPENDSYVPILYHDTNFALAFVHATGEGQLPDAEIVALSYSSYDETVVPDLFYFNSITLKSDLEEVKQAFGVDERELFGIESESYIIRCMMNDAYGVGHIIISEYFDTPL